MQKSIVERPEIKLVGITVRTHNRLETDPTMKGFIGATVNKYRSEQIAEKILHRVNPGVTYSVYTEYESDYLSDYTYFIGEEVAYFENTPEGCREIVIPPQKYIKFTTSAGKMPAICINAWHEIWNMSDADLGGIRAYKADFELYDQRAADPENTILDIFIGIK